VTGRRPPGLAVFGGSRWRLRDAVAVALALFVAATVKGACARASADELGFLLAPTAWLVEAASGYAFERELGTGYFSRDAGLVIAPVCAGVNFFVVALVALVVGFTRRFSRVAGVAAWLGAATAGAYAATLLVNAARIALWLGAGRALAVGLGVRAHELHRALGVGVYLAGLLSLHALADRCSRRDGAARAAIVWPLALYVGATLVVPVLRGVASGPTYTRHALVVLVAVATATLAAVGVRAVQSPAGQPRNARR